MLHSFTTAFHLSLQSVITTQKGMWTI